MKWFLEYVRVTKNAYTVTISLTSGFFLKNRVVIAADEHGIGIAGEPEETVPPKLIPWTSVVYLELLEEE